MCLGVCILTLRSICMKLVVVIYKIKAKKLPSHLMRGVDPPPGTADKCDEKWVSTVICSHLRSFYSLFTVIWHDQLSQMLLCLVWWSGFRKLPMTVWMQAIAWGKKQLWTHPQCDLHQLDLWWPLGASNNQPITWCKQNEKNQSQTFFWIKKKRNIPLDMTSTK